MKIWKKLSLVIIAAASLLGFFALIYSSSPYRALRPYGWFGKKLPDALGVSNETVENRVRVLIPGEGEMEDFYIDQIPVTIGDYKKCVESGACEMHHYRDNFLKMWTDPFYASFPVSFVVWEEARQYCLSKGGDLPTAAQWSFAASNGSGSLYAWGDQDPTMALANADGFYQSLTPAGWLPRGASASGLLDMNGNVREWVLDENPDQSGGRALKGGAFTDGFADVSNESILYHYPISAGLNRGFRCVYPK